MTPEEPQPITLNMVTAIAVIGLFVGFALGWLASGGGCFSWN